MQRLILPVLFGLFLSQTAVSQEMSEPEIRDVVRSFLDVTQSYQARFEQVVTDERGVIVEEGIGTFWLQRPGRLRWHYDQPWERDIAATDEQIWMYDAELEQLTIRSATGALESTPAALLLGEVAVLDNYKLAGTRADAAQTIRLWPRDGGGDFAEIGMVFANDRLDELLLFDRFGQRTRIQFTNIVVNEAIDPSVFNIDVPETADIIDESGF